MKKRKTTARIAAAALALVTAIGLCSCSGGAGGGSDTGTKTYTVGICQLAQHPALDAATKGFRAALVDKLGDKVKFDEQNASGETPNCNTIINSFISKNVDLILANATPALQTAASATEDIPILGTAVTEYGSALNIADFNGTVGGNVSGTSDLAPLSDQAKMFKELLPDVKTVGLLYCSSEANSLYQVKVIADELKKLGIDSQQFAFSDGNDLAAVTTAAIGKCDALYVPTDNTIASSTGIIDGICRPAKVPVIAGEEGICSGCGIATLSINYYDLGYTTGLMAAKILTGEAKISEMPIEYAPKVTKKYNAEICKELGISVSDEYTAIEAE